MALGLTLSGTYVRIPLVHDQHHLYLALGPLDGRTIAVKVQAAYNAATSKTSTVKQQRQV